MEAVEITADLNCGEPQESTDTRSLQYRWAVSKGIIAGHGREVTWLLHGVSPGTYLASVTAKDEDGNRSVCNLEGIGSFHIVIVLRFPKLSRGGYS